MNELHDACKRGDLRKVTSLISDEECDINALNTDGESPLHIACNNGRLEIVKVLLKDQKCILNTQNNCGNTPLHLACNRKLLHIIRLLLKRRCSTNIPNRQAILAQCIHLNGNGDSLLHIACQWGDVDIVKYLIIDEKCNPSIRSHRSRNTPLHIAAMYGQVDTIVQLLFCKNSNPNAQNKEGDTPLHLAASWNKTAVISKLLADQQCDITAQNKEGNTPLHLACYERSLDVVKLLLEMRCSTNIPNDKGETAQDIPLNEDGDRLLHIACQWGDVGVVKYLIIDEKCNPSIRSHTSGNTPLHIAAMYGQVDTIVQLLFCKKINPNAQNKEGDTPLHLAASWNKTAVIFKLLANKQCDITAQNKEGNTPLHLACYERSLDVVKLLLEMRCSTNIPNKKGKTAQDILLNEDGDRLLHIACQWGDVDIVMYLINDEKCNPSTQSHTSGNTPLHIAAMYGQVDTIVNLLFCKNSNPNAQNKEGDTPLHLAASWNKTAVISKLLADQQCDITAQNKEGNTPLHLACYERSLVVVKLLLEMRCSTNIPNKKGETAQDIPLNEDGDHLLHVACQWGDLDIVRYLTHQKCKPNVLNANVDTPLHIACYSRSLDIIKCLLKVRCGTNIPNKKGETAQDILFNEDGDRLLHIACQWGDVDIVMYLINDEKCNPSTQSHTSGNTPLHIAAMYGQVDTVVQLLFCKNSNTNAQNKEGDTPLHLAASWNKTAVISKLLADQQCDITAQNKEGNTPLHLACYERSLDVVKLLLEMRCSTNIPNKKGETAQDILLNEDGDRLLHIACQWGDVGVVRYLINDERCNLNVQSYTSENTPLHIATKYGQEDTIIQLMSYKECDVNVQNKEGDIPLHIAARENRTPAISQLLNNKQCNSNVLNNDHLTPLLTAIKHNNPTVAAALLQHDKCDPTLCDPHGNTPLHLACISGETHPEMLKVAKQLLTTVDPSCVNNAGQTPIELTTNYQLIQVISHFVKCKTKQSVQTYINVFIVGNPETGKSSLVKAICKEATSILWKIVPKQVRKVKNVPLHTAGIIPTTFRSKAFGNTVIYDLAGHVEYYTSHAAVIRSTTISTPPAFIVVVNLSESEEKISRTLRYWWSFIDNHAAQSSAPPQVILVGSHADVVKSTGESVQQKMTLMTDLLKQFPASFHFAGQVALDCRDPASRKLQVFCTLVNQSCTVLREAADVDLHCHVLYAFLLDKFQDKVACMVSDVTTSIKETSALLPQKLDNLIPLISTLSDKGLLLLVKGGESCGGWWVILQKQALLGEMNGVIFAPKCFRQHKDLSWSTGVVPFFKLKNQFPDYDPNMVSEFLTHLEFCFKIEDQQTLALLKNEAANMENTSLDVSEEYYFFPALVSVENPLHIWEQNDKMCCSCGWFYQCMRPDQFLTTQFLHVLILRLAFTFALKLDPGDCCESSLTLRRKCSVWKHGIAWLNGAPIETVVEVGLQFQSVIVMMRCPKSKEAKCVQLRTEVIQKVLKVKDEHCQAVQMFESFIHPTDVKYPFIDNTEHVKLYSLTAIARSTVSEEEALDQRGRNPIPVQDLLLFDPHTGIELLSELFGRKHSLDEEMRRQVLETLNKDTSKPRFANSKRGSIMNQFDPVTLRIQQTDETMMKAVRLFACQVVLILHTCNVNEYWAALERLEPPTKKDGSEIRGRSITYPQVGSVIGWFAGYRAAVVRTGQGNKCRDELTTALTKSFPNGKVIIGAGIAYTNNRKRNFADVLISDRIENFVQYKIVDNKITNRGPREQIDPSVQTVFENPARDWTDMKHFICTDDNRSSVAHIGCIVSAPTLVQDELLRDQLMKHTPDCIGGEMEGWILLELKRALKGQHNKDIEVIIVKGVADYDDHTNGDQWQWTAAKAAIDCIHYCLDKSGGIEFSAISQQAVIEDMEAEATSNATPPGTKPTLPELLKFTCTDGRVLNIPVEIATKYVQFGTFLLDDRNGSKVKIMARKHLNDAEEINTEILQEWLAGRGKQPVTWVTLIKVLHDIELSSLADEIEAVKCPQDQSQVSQFYVATSHVTEK